MMGFKQPGSYTPPSQKNAVAAPVQPANTVNVETPKRAAKGKEGMRKQSVSSAAKFTSSKSVQLRLVVHPPQKGQVPLYDEMMQTGIEPKAALLGLLKRGFPKFEQELLKGKAKASSEDFKSLPNPINTTRNVSPEFIEAARTLFDPFAVMSDRALGRKIAETIIRSAKREK